MGRVDLMTCRFPSRILFFIFLGLAFFQGLAIGQEAETVSVPFVASAGDRFEVAIRKERSQKGGGRRDKHLIFVSKYAGAIEEMNDEGMIISWSLTNFHVEQVEAKPPIPASELENFLKEFQLPLRFQADEFGRPAKLLNRKEFQNKLSTLMKTEQAPDKKEAIAFVEKMFFTAPDDQFVNVFLQEAALIGQGQSLELPKSEPVKGESDQLTPIGKTPIKFISELHIVSDNDAELVVEQTGRFDEVSVKSAVTEVFNQFAKSAKTNKKPPPDPNELMKQLQLKSDVRIIFQISKANGWITHISYNKVVRVHMGDQQMDRDDTWKIDVTPPK